MSDTLDDADAVFAFCASSTTSNRIPVDFRIHQDAFYRALRRVCMSIRLSELYVSFVRTGDGALLSAFHHDLVDLSPAVLENIEKWLLHHRARYLFGSLVHTSSATFFHTVNYWRLRHRHCPMDPLP